MSLHLVWIQLRLPGMERPGPLHPSFPGDKEARDARTAAQWLRSAIRYCDWRADATAHLGRFNADRMYYLSGRRLLADLIAGRSESKIQLVLPGCSTSPSSSLPHDFPGRSRAWLADKLLSLDPRLTDKKILARLPRTKLLRMLAVALEEALAEERRTA